jgi:DNA-binding MarR family transcriptional regulator
MSTDPARDGTTGTPFPLRPDQLAELSDDERVLVDAFRMTLLAASRMRAAMDERMRADGITTQQAALVTVVDAAGSPSLSEAADALRCTRQNLKQIARALERKGFLEIRPDPEDGRVSRLATTGRSRAYWASRDAGDLEVIRGWFAGASPAELRTLVRTLRGAVDRLADSDDG